MAVYNFDPTTAPPAGQWPTQTNVTSNGVNWVLAGGVSASLNSGNLYAAGGDNELEVQAVMNMPSTAASYNGITIAGNTVGSVSIDLHWEAQNHYDARVGGTYVYVGPTAGGTDITVKIIINKYGVSFFMGGVCVYNAANPFGASTLFAVSFNKYTEANPGLIKSGYIDSRTVTAPNAPAARTTGFLSTLGMGK